MAFTKFTANTNSVGGTNLLQEGPVDRPNPLLNQIGEHNNFAFAAPPQPGQFTHQQPAGMRPEPARNMPASPFPPNNFVPVPQQPVFRPPVSGHSAFSPRVKQSYQSPFGKPNYSSPLAQPVSAANHKQLSKTSPQVKVAPLSGPLNVRNLAFNGALAFLVLAVTVTGYIYFTHDETATEAQVAGKATNSEVVSQVAAEVIVPNESPKLFSIDNPAAVKQKDPIFFASVAEGDYLLLYETKSVLYRPSERKIVAVMDKSLN